jgi:hypothetical protein
MEIKSILPVSISGKCARDGCKKFIRESPVGIEHTTWWAARAAARQS